MVSVEENHEPLQFLLYMTKNQGLELNVGGMLHKNYSSYRFDLEALNHPVQKRPRPSVKGESSSASFYFLKLFIIYSVMPQIKK